MPEWYQKLPLELIQNTAKKYGLDLYLVASICQHESGGEKWRTRWEPKTERYVIQYRDYASRLGISPETERMAQMHSYGLMQVMGFKAREMRYDSYLGRLCIADVGVDYGCQFLQKLTQKYHEECDVISAYNWGSVRKTVGGMYLNQVTYVDPVCALLRELRKIR